MKVTPKIRAEIGRKVMGLFDSGGCGKRTHRSHITLIRPFEFVNIMPLSGPARLSHSPLTGLSLRDLEGEISPDAYQGNLILLRFDVRSDSLFWLGDAFVLLCDRGNVLLATNKYAQVRKLLPDLIVEHTKITAARVACFKWRCLSRMPLWKTRNPVPLGIVADWLEEKEPKGDEAVELSLIRFLLENAIPE